MFALYVFGGEVLEGFAFTMLVGIISGTYSTVFIASAIAIGLSKRRRRGPGRRGGRHRPGGSTTAGTTRPTSGGGKKSSTRSTRKANAR